MQHEEAEEKRRIHEEKLRLAKEKNDELIMQKKMVIFITIANMLQHLKRNSMSVKLETKIRGSNLRES